MPLLGGRVGPGLTASDSGNQARGGHRREAAQRQNAAPAADHCVLPSGLSGLLRHEHPASRHSVSARLRAGHGSPWRTCLVPPGRQPAGELLADGEPDLPVGDGTIDTELAGFRARTSSLIWNPWPRSGTTRIAEPSFLTTTAVSAVTPR